MSHRRNIVIAAMVLLVMGVATQPAYAGTATGLPWENALDTLINAITGKIALAISVGAIFVTGGMLAFGGEISDFTKKACCEHQLKNVRAYMGIERGLFNPITIKGK